MSWSLIVFTAVFIDLNCERSILYGFLLPWFCVLLLAVATRVEKVHKKKDSAVKFSRVPKIVKNEGEMIEELTTRRRRAWISAISRGDLTDDKLEHERVCSRHFVSGQAAKQWDQFDVDWVPTLPLGHTKRLQRIDP